MLSLQGITEKMKELRVNSMSLLKKFGFFAGGVLFGTAGIKILSSKDAKKVYSQTTAAGLRAKESLMTTATKVKESANDIVADAKDINEKREEERQAQAQLIEDTSTAEEV